MKLNFRIMLLGAVCFTVLGAPNCASAQIVQIPVTGGYNATTIDEADVKSAAKFAVKTRTKNQKAKIKLIAVRKVEKQIVAGLNFRLCMQIETTEKNQKTAVPQIVEAIVYQDSKSKYSLTSWAIAACAEETILPNVKK